MNTAELNTMTL